MDKHTLLAFRVFIALLVAPASVSANEVCSSPYTCADREEDPDLHVLIQHKIEPVASSKQELLLAESGGREELVHALDTSKPKGKAKPKRPQHGHQNHNTVGDDLRAHMLSANKLMKLSLGMLGVLFLASFVCLAWAGSRRQFEWDFPIDDVEHEERMSAPLDEDMYGLAVSLLVRDTAVLEAGEGHGLLRQLRFALVFLLVFLNKALQVFLVFQVLQLVTPKIIQTSSKNYDMFEWHMYGRNESHIKILADGTRRGLPGFFNKTLFDTLSPIVKADTCNVPFSQPAFFIVVLFVWALTCLSDLRKCLDMFDSLIVSTPTVTELEHMVDTPSSEKSYKKRIIGLTWRKKVFISVIILIPRAILTTVLLWLGSRWLASTNNFGDLIMNTVALEFILLIQNLFYVSIVPARNKRDCQSIETMPPHTHEQAGLYVFASSFLWGIVALIWALVYTYYLQQVLPAYNWDVREVCATWLGSS